MATPSGSGKRAAASAKAAKESYDLLERQAELQQKLNANSSEYFTILKKIGSLQANIDAQTKIRGELQAKKDAARRAGDIAEFRASHEKIKLLDEELKKLKDTKDMYVQVAKEANKTTIAFKEIGKQVSKIPGALAKGYGLLKGYGVFDMDKSMKSAALEMGVLSKQTLSFRKNITDSVMGTGQLNSSTLELGIGFDELSKMQADYSSSIGRSVEFTDAGRQAMAELAKGTVLGADGAAEMASEMDKFGKSAEDTRDFIEDTMDKAHKMGLNASTVTKNIQGGMKLLNQYNFKDGREGLAKMAATAAKMGTSMNLVSGMAEKLFDIEGAVEMSAQLQVLGGEWSKLADPFQLMYMARNDMAGLNEAVINATKNTAQFSKTSKTFEIPAMEMQRLRKVTEQTGLNFEELATSARKAAQYAGIESQMNISVDKDTKEFITSVATLDDNGKASIKINGANKLVSALKETDLADIKKLAAEKASLKDRAKESQNFDEALTNTLTLFKSALLPVVETLNETLMPMITKMFGDEKFKKQLADLGNTIATFVSGIAGVAKFAGKIITTLGPTGTLAVILGVKGLMAAGQWITNGVNLAMGFNSVANAGGGVGGKGGKGGIGKRIGGAAGLGAAGMLVGMGTDAVTDAGSTGNIIGKAAAGALNGAAIGTLLLPGIGTAIGAAVGGLWGGYQASQSGTPMNDGIIGSPVHDGSFPGFGGGVNQPKLGSDFSKGRGIVQGGKITPIDNKDDLIAAKPRGVVDSAMKAGSSGTMKVSFDEIKFSGNINLSMPGGAGNVDITKYLLNNQEFIRDITRMVHVQTSKAINGGKISSEPVN